jgi:hypothetical protein
MSDIWGLSEGLTIPQTTLRNRPVFFQQVLSKPSAFHCVTCLTYPWHIGRTMLSVRFALIRPFCHLSIATRRRSLKSQDILRYCSPIVHLNNALSGWFVAWFVYSALIGWRNRRSDGRSGWPAWTCPVVRGSQINGRKPSYRRFPKWVIYLVGKRGHPRPTAE